MKNVLLLETIADEALELLEKAENIQIFTAYGDEPLEKILSEKRASRNTDANII